MPVRINLKEARKGRWTGAGPRSPSNGENYPAQAMQPPSTSDDSDERVVVPLKKGAHQAGQPQGGTPPPATNGGDDPGRYQRQDDSDNDRHRMITNSAGLAIAAALIGAGIWNADTMASMRKNQDCVLSGRRGCTPVDAPLPRRW